MIWVLFAAMTLAVFGVLLWPLLRSRQAVAQAGTHVTVYRAQLAEIDRDVASGRLADADAQAARTELGRRLLAEDRPERADAPSPWRRVAAAVLVAIACAGGAALYGVIGSPKVPDAPLSARKTAPDAKDFAAGLARIETHLASSPDDLSAWNVVAPLYLRMRRSDDAVRAYANILRLAGDGADRRTNYAEAQIYAAQGIVTADARKELERAVSLDATHVKARYYLGLAAQQDGNRDLARDTWSKIAAEAPPNSPLAKGLATRIAALDQSAMAADVAALPADAQQAAIRGMVERLAGRLQEKGDDLEGWLRLVRAYRVLDEPDKARDALADARRSFLSDAAARTRLDALARELGLES